MDNKNQNSIWKQILSFMIVFFFSLACAVLVIKFFAYSAYTPTESMYNTLQTKDKFVISRIEYKNKDPQRGDIISLNSTQASKDEPRLIKRIIGLPGDTIEIKQGNVYVNGTLLKENYALKDKFTSQTKYVVPENCYFVMGDNRANFFHRLPNGKTVLRFYSPVKHIFISRYVKCRMHFWSNLNVKDTVNIKIYWMRVIYYV